MISIFIFFLFNLANYLWLYLSCWWWTLLLLLRWLYLLHSSFCFSFLLSTNLLQSSFYFSFLVSFPPCFLLPLAALCPPLSIFLLLSSTLFAAPWLPSAFLLIFFLCCFCVVSLLFDFAFDLLLFSWFVLFESTSLSLSDSILFPPPVTLLVSSASS